MILPRCPDESVNTLLVENISSWSIAGHMGIILHLILAAADVREAVVVHFLLEKVGYRLFRHVGSSLLIVPGVCEAQTYDQNHSSNSIIYVVWALVCVPQSSGVCLSSSYVTFSTFIRHDLYYRGLLIGIETGQRGRAQIPSIGSSTMLLLLLSVYVSD